MKERIQKILANSGICSRRKAEDLIREGRVMVNGRVAEIGMKADLETDYIRIDGKLVLRPEPRKYIIMNKPRGVITALSDPEGRPTVKDLLKGLRVRVYPVGRLDFNSEGLLLLTNDGDLANRIIHPRHKVPKKYLVKVKGRISDEDIWRLRKGVMLEDGMTLPAKVRRVRMPRSVNNSWIEITIREGKKRQIRRMLEKIGHPVLKLKRTAINGLKLSGLLPGQWRELSPEEVKRLKEHVKITV
ncbi:MAG: rRNA pseudouridine synthase [Nitrospirae bacterium]|nr:MAG: rRNA pseudouridine synthase [Nitrospirota bacterium]